MTYFIIIIGLLIGSFLNVCIYRISKEESIVYPLSYCPKCNTTLKSWSLVPIFSFLLSKRKCRYCRELIPMQYPFIEFLNGIIYLLLYLKYGLSILFVKYAIITSLLIMISWIDYKLQIIPDGCNLFGLVISGVFIIINDFSTGSFLNSVIGFCLGGGIFLLIAIVTNEMGGGDIKLMGILGFAFGWENILLITLLSFGIGAIISVGLLRLKIKNRKDPIAFGPFIAVATGITILYGREIFQWYILYTFR
ncbi:prepilin peptidase [Marinisporobacter balticus]|uniref:Leader peptidase (Prepilin peptidase)/N-methyltransferase n=1 Tax=Marinisporobacter balticus TaxID=2018667 RepID=A0A4R2KX66_9FIRM|nr:A24 family peptidase [Marinisporobacter balticus]TCO79171.1 leader peptidase (prepilin peptidase)/N-methyltransferase [Marinisporobacter balticus]